MATVKSLTRSHSDSQTQSHYNSHYEQKAKFLDKLCSPSGTSLHQTDNCLFNPFRFNSSSIIDSAQRRLASVCQILPFFTPVTTSSSISDCYSHNLDNPLLTSSVDYLQIMEISMPSFLNSCPLLASTDSTDILSEQLPCCPDRTDILSEQLPCRPESDVPPPSQQHSVVDKENNILSSSVNKSSQISASQNNIHNRSVISDKMVPVVSSSTSSLRGSKLQQGCSHVNITFDDINIEKSEKSAKKSLPSCDCLVPNKRKQKDSPSNASSAVNKNAKFGTSVDSSTPGMSLKPIKNLAFVLSAPRKIFKKGRPSSKKQKKRNREKGKRESSPLQTKEIVSASKVNNKIKPSHSDSQSFEFAVGLSQQGNNPIHSSRIFSSEFKNKGDKQSDSVKTTSRFCLLFRQKSSSEEVDDDDDDEWPVNEHNTVCISPIDSFGFNFALTLDSIFKKADSPKSLLNAKTNGSSASCTKNSCYQDVRKSLCKSDSYDDSDFEICASSESAEFSDNDYATYLSKDFLSHSKILTTENLFKTATDLSDNDHLLADSSNSQTYGQATDFETLKRVNAQWNEYYPTAGFLSCKPKDDKARDATIKVHFAAEPELLTVHILEEEERSSKWLHYALDRKRFERRILELEKIISPVLDADHRVKVLEHRL